MGEPTTNLHQMAATAWSDDDVSLFRGGPFYRAQGHVHLVGPGDWKLGRRAGILGALTWLPLVILTLLFAPHALGELLRSYPVYARLLVASPVLLLGQWLMDNRSGAILTHVRLKRLLEPEDQARLNATIATLRRWRDSIYPELAIALLVYSFELTMIARGRWLSGAPAWIAAAPAAGAHLTPAGSYYALISIPIYLFLLVLNCWKWVSWSVLLRRLSKARLRLVGTHPDGHGGLGFLSLSVAGFTPIAFAVSAVVGADWRELVLHQGATLASFRLPAIIMFAILVQAAITPLIFFVPRLAVLRHKAMLEYGVLAQRRVAAFEARWLRARDSNQVPFTPDEISELAHLTTAYGNLKHLRPLPLDLNTLLGLAAALVLPLAPVVLAEVPLKIILKGLLIVAKGVPM